MTTALKIAVYNMRMLTDGDIKAADAICAGIDALAKERDAAIARAEKAERELMTVQEWARVWSARVDLVEVEAARLREALVYARQEVVHHNCMSEGCPACDIDAALAPAATEAPKSEGTP